MSSDSILICDDPFLSIAVSDETGSTRFTGQAKIDAITVEQIRERAGDFGLAVAWIDVPFHGEAHGWVPLYFVKR